MGSFFCGLRTDELRVTSARDSQFGTFVSPGITTPNGQDFGSSGSRSRVRYHDTMTKNITVRLPEDLAAAAEAVARAEGTSLNETIKSALTEAVERRRKDPAFKKRVREIIQQDRELLERLAK